MSKKKKKGANKDLLAVLFIFAVMILAAIGMTMCGRDKVEIGGEKSGTRIEQREKDNSGQIVIMTAAGIAVVIVICFAVKKARDAERRNRAIREHNERLEERKRIEEARERVRQARLQEMIDAGIRQLTDNDSRRRNVIRTGNASHRLWDDEFDSLDIDDKRLDEYYRNKYDDLDEDLDDDLFDDQYDEAEYTLFQRIKYMFMNMSVYWWIVIVAVVGGLIIAIVAL